jgi:hypothetical protein
MKPLNEYLDLLSETDLPSQKPLTLYRDTLMLHVTAEAGGAETKSVAGRRATVPHAPTDFTNDLPFIVITPRYPAFPTVDDLLPASAARPAQ